MSNEVVFPRWYNCRCENDYFLIILFNQYLLSAGNKQSAGAVFIRERGSGGAGERVIRSKSPSRGVAESRLKSSRVHCTAA
jgi:hypothetical protein